MAYETDYTHAPGQVPTPEVERNFQRGGAQGRTPTQRFGYTPPAIQVQTGPLGGAAPGTATNGLTPTQLMGIGNIMGMNDQFLQQQLGALQAQTNAQVAGAGAAAAGVDAERDRINYALKSGLRDIEQETEAAVEGATHNATQRGIYDSGIRIENQEYAQREGAEAEQDLRANTQFALRALNARAGAIRSQIDAIRQAAAAQAQMMQSGHDLQQAQWLSELFGTPMDMAAFEELYSGAGQPAQDTGIRYQ